MKFIKDYQVTEHKDGKWSVVEVGGQTVMGEQLVSSISMKKYGFETAAEAQELADQLNEQEQGK